MKFKFLLNLFYSVSYIQIHLMIHILRHFWAIFLLPISLHSGVSIKFPRLFSCIPIFCIMVLVSFIPRTYNRQRTSNMPKTSVGSSHSLVILSYLIETVAVLTLVLLSQPVTMARTPAFPWQRSLRLIFAFNHSRHFRLGRLLNRTRFWQNQFRPCLFRVHQISKTETQACWSQPIALTAKLTLRCTIWLLRQHANYSL